MSINNVLEKQNIAFDIKATTKNDALRYLSKQLFDSGKINSVESFYQALLDREAIAETGLGDGIAIPHGKDSSVLQASIAFVRLADYVEWESIDDKPVRYVFVLAIPENDNDNNHIMMLSNLARQLIKKEVIEQIHNAKDAETLLSVF